MIGTIVNTVSIIFGGSVGTFLGDKLAKRYKETVMQGITLAVLLLGLKMALGTQNPTIVIFSLLLGALAGETIRIEKKLNQFGAWLEKKFKGQGSIAEGFVQCSLLYCVGAMAIMGAIQDGLQQDPTTLYAKSLLDGFSAIAFSSTLGIGVVLSAIPVLIYQGSITLLASWVQILLTEEVIIEMTATGGLLIVAIALNMFDLTEIKVGNLLPAIFVAVILAFFI